MNKQIKGTITPALLIITGAFTIVIYGLLMVLTTQLDFSQRQIASEMALHIAEAGVNYYRWHLAHAPTDYQDGTNNPGPYVHTYSDPQQGEVGTYSLEITPPTNGSTLVTIKSTGVSKRFPSIKRTITASFGKESLAKYLFLSNASTWYGTGITVNGNIHSNNGIRMDGVNTGLVSSAKDEYMCGSETGCSPPTRKPGVWGSGSGSSLWNFPVTSIDFDSVSADFVAMREAAQNSGLYLGPSNSFGYHLLFTNTGSVTVKRITGLDYYNGYVPPGDGLGANGQGGCRRRYQRITNEQTINTYSVANTPIIFAEDNLWVEGVVSGRVTAVAAGFPISSSTMDIWIPNSITYRTGPGTDVLGLIAQNNIMFTRDIPNDLVINGVLMAQKGQVIRHGYIPSCGSSTYSVRNSLTINGGIISYNKSYWNYGSPNPSSGFITRTINYDGNLLYSPPPYFPTSGEFEFVSWREE